MRGKSKTACLLAKTAKREASRLKRRPCKNRMCHEQFMFCTIHFSHMHIVTSFCIATRKMKGARTTIMDAPRPACAALAQEACRFQRSNHRSLSKMPHRCQKVPIGLPSSIEDGLFFYLSLCLLSASAARRPRP